MLVTKIKKEEHMNLKESNGVYRGGWKKKREGRNDVIKYKRNNRRRKQGILQL